MGDDPPEIGDGLCSGAEEYNNINCGFDGDDCLRFMKDYPNCQVEEPNRVGDGVCDSGSYNTGGCEWDGGDCDCRVDIPEWLGDGTCDDWDPYNTPACKSDGGDCMIDGLPEHEWWNNHPDCHVDRPDNIGDGNCDGAWLQGILSWIGIEWYFDAEYNTIECGFDGGDCCYSFYEILYGILYGILFFIKWFPIAILYGIFRIPIAILYSLFRIPIAILYSLFWIPIGILFCLF